MAPILSVCMISYNHEAFIEEAIKSILEQKTSFAFDLIISDDASGDRTNEKIIEVTKNIPKHITLRYVAQNPNIGMMANFEFALNQCFGTYVAICEGDDYWIDDKKLQKQVDFLESNPDYNIVTGYVRQYIEISKKFAEPHNLKSFTFGYKDMIIKNHCPTCATMYRNFTRQEGALKLIPTLGGDFQLWMRTLGKEGKAMKVDEVLAVYRRHENSATGVRNKKLHSYAYFKNMVKDKIRIAEFWNDYFGNEATDYVLRLKVSMYKKMTKVSYDRNKFFGFLRFYFNYRSSQFLLKSNAPK